MELSQKITESWKTAMRERDDKRKLVLSGLRGAIQNEEKNNKVVLDDAGVVKVVQREIKKRRDSISEYEKVQRQDRADDEKAELEILQEFLPEQMDEQELRMRIDRAIETTGAETIKDMGKVMKAVMPEVQGKAEGAQISSIIKELLTLRN